MIYPQTYLSTRWKFSVDFIILVLYPVFQDQHKPFIGSCLFWCKVPITCAFDVLTIFWQDLFLGKDDISYPFSEAPVTALHDVDAKLVSGPVHNCELHIQAGRLDSHLYLWGVKATISTNNVYVPLKYLGLAWYGYLGYFDLVNYGRHMMSLVDVEFSCQYSKRIYCYGAPQC